MEESIGEASTFDFNLIFSAINKERTALRSGKIRLHASLADLGRRRESKRVKRIKESTILSTLVSSGVSGANEHALVSLMGLR
ncbi:hypothetical protein Tco_1257109, partial [Tanacetum coccineum]